MQKTGQAAGQHKILRTGRKILRRRSTSINSINEIRVGSVSNSD
jgi:hypothetical protein